MSTSLDLDNRAPRVAGFEVPESSPFPAPTASGESQGSCLLALTVFILGFRGGGVDHIGGAGFKRRGSLCCRFRAATVIPLPTVTVSIEAQGCRLVPPVHLRGSTAWQNIQRPSPHRAPRREVEVVIILYANKTTQNLTKIVI